MMPLPRMRRRRSHLLALANSSKSLVTRTDSVVLGQQPVSDSAANNSDSILILQQPQPYLVQAVAFYTPIAKNIQITWLSCIHKNLVMLKVEPRGTT